MNQGFALYNYIHRNVKNKYLTKMCFFIISDLLTKYDKLVLKRMTKNPERRDMKIKPGYSDIEVEFTEKGDLEIRVPRYFDLYYGFVRRIINNSISKWFIECKVKGTVIR